MEMKKLLESLQECGMAPMGQQEGAPVSMNISLNASGKDHVADLINMMKNAGLQAAQPVNPEMMPMRMDMEKFRNIVDGPMESEEEVEEWDNSPEGVEDEPEVQDTEFMTKDLAGGLNGEKKMYKAAQRGDNAMAAESIKAQLMQALAEKKAKPDFLDMDKDGNKKEPMKKAVKDKGSKPKKGKVPPQFKKK